MGLSLRDAVAEPYDLIAAAAGGAKSTPLANGLLYSVRLTYSGADGSTTAAIAIVNGADANTIITVTGNTTKTVFPRGTATKSDGSDSSTTNTEIYAVAQENIRLTVTGNGTVTARVKLLA